MPRESAILSCSKFEIGLTKHKIVGDVRGKGLMIGIEFVRDQKTKERAPELRNRIVQTGVSQRIAGPGRGRKFLAARSSASD